MYIYCLPQFLFRIFIILFLSFLFLCLGQRRVQRGTHHHFIFIYICTIYIRYIYICICKPSSPFSRVLIPLFSLWLLTAVGLAAEVCRNRRTFADIYIYRGTLVCPSGNTDSQLICISMDTGSVIIWKDVATLSRHFLWEE